MTDISFLRTLSPSRVSRAGKVGAILLAGLPISASFGASYSWLNVTGTFTDATKWAGGVAPLGTDPTDILTFGGAAGSPYIATSNSATNPFLINQLVFTGTGTSTTVTQTIDGTTPIKLGGVNPMLLQSGTTDVTIKVPIQLGGNLTIAGTGVGTLLNETNKITLDGTLSGLANITKNGTFTFRFGSSASTAYSQNTWFGGLTINDGIIRFNNNAYAAPTALRGNPVTMNAATALIYTKFGPKTGTGSDPDSSLRMGTLTGTAGTVKAQREVTVGGITNFDSVDIVIATLDSGTFGGTVDNSLSGTGDNNGRLIIRGPGTQTFTGTLLLAKDVVVGTGSGMTLAANTTHQGQSSSSAVILNGGTFTLDNTTTSNPDRLRNSTGTGLETIGGGKFSFIGNASATLEENMGRLQLGSASTPRSGALTINVTNNGMGTTLRMDSYQRINTNLDTTQRPMNTVNFTANDGAQSFGATTTTGSHVVFTGSVLTTNSLLANSSGTGNLAWATVNSRDFAGYSITLGVQAITSSPAPVGTGTGSSTTNAFLNSGLSLTNASGYSLSSLKIDPASAGLSIDIASSGNFSTYGILLAGTTDFEINSSGSGQIASVDGISPRYFHVPQAMLTVEAGLAGSNTPIVKSGAGLLNLTGANTGVTAPLVINEGTVRVTPGLSLPTGELRFRGGVLELNGGTFARQLGGSGSNTINWTGIISNLPVGEDQGSGGFSAFGSDVTVDLATLIGGSDFAWEDTGFVNSGHALIFGSPRANAKVTWVDNLNLTATGQVTNYNAREIRVIDNPSSTADAAILSGKISGVVNDDLLKTGAGTLILTSALSDYRGATIVHEGALLVNGVISTSFLANVRNNATLGGSGTVGRVKVESGGTLAPGNALGNTSVLTTGDMILSAAGAKLSIELGGTTIGGNGVNGYDQIVALGEIVLNGGTLVGTLLPGFVADPGTLFFIASNDGTDPVQGTFAQGSQILIGGEPFNISYAGNFTGDPLTSTFTGGNDIVLQYVPEPTSAALLACGAAALGLARRRRPAATA